ncbi:hypothetical protein BHM03_00058080 [Ensete ventricosum]|nr:hypothetical protein BHM03_00058080 [Ensete ventricosum]
MKIQYPLRGGRPWPTPLQGRPTTMKVFCGGSRLQKATVPPAVKLQGRLPAVRPHEATVVGAATLAARVATPWQGDCRSQER